MRAIDDRYGTARGLVRLMLAHAQLGLGRAAMSVPDPAAVRRLVFVCHGNICRSAFAEVAARRAGLRAASFGLSAEAGKPAHPPAVAAADLLGFDLGAHRAITHLAFVPEPGDLLLAMETRQLDRLAADPRLAAIPRSLLGLYIRPPCPHLHDPYGLGAAYMTTCLKRIETAISTLATRFPNAVCG